MAKKDLDQLQTALVSAVTNVFANLQSGPSTTSNKDDNVDDMEDFIPSRPPRIPKRFVKT